MAAYPPIDADGNQALHTVAACTGQQEQHAGNQANGQDQRAGIQSGRRLLLIQGEVSRRRDDGHFVPDHECREGERDQQQDPAHGPQAGSG